MLLLLVLLQCVLAREAGHWPMSWSCTGLGQLWAGESGMELGQIPTELGQIPTELGQIPAGGLDLREMGGFDACIDAWGLQHPSEESVRDSLPVRAGRAVLASFAYGPEYASSGSNFHVLHMDLLLPLFSLLRNQQGAILFLGVLQRQGGMN